MTGNRFSFREATPTNNLTVMDTLKAILVGLGIPEHTIREDTLIHAHLGLDSVETVKLSLELKRKLNIDLKLGTRNDITLADICRIAESAVPAQSL
jgi:acyl carrier protein